MPCSTTQYGDGDGGWGAETSARRRSSASHQLPARAKSYSRTRARKRSRPSFDVDVRRTHVRVYVRDVLACWFGVDRSTVTRAIGEVRPLLAERKCTISLDMRLQTWPSLLTISARPGGPASSTAPRSVSAARPSVARIGITSSPARTSRTL
ncbi:transposase family protein [Streptomyces sp. NPDC056178]|uniref:transposase family protein n=1 Tax=unclassified Streptomyces TaxID=2593676 RepID=UPI0035E1BB5F